ncbi:hypothetical protein EDD16DRAFT_1834398 [Pisolithus croceorrhizus]|nr:hypothetical protein EDD16DRAFT_1834398 [Pisolithus croceorrhizus]
MPPKSLSTTTLALRFMKHGVHRQAEQQRVELEQARVKDDAEWEVSEEVRRAWEVVHGGDEDRKHVTYEQSYLPFLFPSLSDGQIGKGGDETRDIGTQNTVSLLPRGRRTFDKHGREDVTTADPPTATTKKLGRLKSISSFGKPQSSKKGKEKTSDEGAEIDREKHERDLSKAAKNVIRDISGVGMDLRAQRPSGFMKPQGVDAPVRVNVKDEDGSPASVPPATADVTLTRRTKMKRVGDTVRLEERDGPRTKKKPKLGTVE